MKKVKDESYCIRALKEAQEKFFKGRGDEDISYGIKVEEDKGKMVITAYAEVGYTTLEKMCDVLNKTLDQYKGRPDANYYFEPDYPGVATCYIWKEKEVKDSKVKDRDPYDNDRDDEYFVVTLENMSKEDAKSYSRCYGLRAKPARTGGYQLAGDEDSVREMLEDYIGRYDKIGKIMNEGYYISSDSFRDSKVKDSPKIYKIDGVEYILSKDGYGNYKLDEKKTGDRVADWDSYSDAIKDINKWIKQNKITDSKKVKDSYEGNLEALEEFLEWEGIIGYDSDIQEIYETNEAWVDDELKTFDTPYEALDAYLEWEGILGYTDAIYDILENGVESPYYNDMLEEKQSYEED